MSTFNGARYLEEQIQSILLQSAVSVKLFIRDDGSTDETVSILERYAADGRAAVTYGNNIGIGKSFIELLYTVPDDFDYYAFSDQDDIWLDDKLFTAVCRLNEERGCALYASNLELVDAENHSIGMRFEPDMVFDGSLLSLICRNKCYGCTQVFNRDLFLFLRRRRPSELMLTMCLHDSWVSVSASIAGKIFFDTQSHIRYRRHETNYTKFDRSKAERWRERLSKLLHREKRNLRSRKAQDVIRQYPEYVESDPDRELICSLAQAAKIENRIALIKHRKRFMVSGESQAWFILKTVVGWI